MAFSPVQLWTSEFQQKIIAEPGYAQFGVINLPEIDGPVRWPGRFDAAVISSLPVISDV